MVQEYELLDVVENETDNSEVTTEEGSQLFDEENTSIIRAKWMFDGAKTIDECIEKCLKYIEFLKDLKYEGWELECEVNDDYGHIRRRLLTQ